MYNGQTVLPATGMAVAVWYPLAGIALLMLGVALLRMAGTFRKEEEGS